MTTKTRTTPTAHGEVDYKTVTCSSCGEEVPKESAARFIVSNDWESKWATGFNDKTTYQFGTTDMKRGWACEYCKEQDPIGYPQKDHIGSTDSAITKERLIVLGISLLNLVMGFVAGIAF